MNMCIFKAMKKDIRCVLLLSRAEAQIIERVCGDLGCSKGEAVRRMIQAYGEGTPTQIPLSPVGPSLEKESLVPSESVVVDVVESLPQDDLKTTKSVEITQAPDEVAEDKTDDHLPVWQRKFTDEQFNALSDREKWIVQTSGKILTDRRGGEMTHLSDTYGTLPWPVLKRFHALLSSRLPDLMRNCPLDNLESFFDYIDYGSEYEGTTDLYLKRVLELREEAIEMTEFEF